MPETYYTHHVFFCTNQRQNCEDCCENFKSGEMRSYMKDRLKEKNLHGPGKVRVSSAGCMGRCELGPVIAVYPEAVWYTWVDEDDIEEIIEQHLLRGQVVERLKI
jgi:(2Fe-2S) ferredoxin